MVTELLQKYIWLVQTFIRAGERGLSLGEISDRWENRFDSPYSRRTFNNHRAAIEEVFGIHIDCDRSSNRYFIGYADDVSDDTAENAWLINTFTVNNILSLRKERLSGRVAVEDIPSGHRHLTGIMEAMTENSVIRIGYRKYTSSEETSYTVRPYAVKEFAKRWYLVGWCEERESLRVYGLDRISDMEACGRNFSLPEGFDVDSLFATSFGIYLPEGPGKTITFRTGSTEARFIQDLPIHPSQTVVAQDGEHTTFSIFVCPDKNLIMEFCKHGHRMEVLSPHEIRKAVAEELKKASNMYAL